MLLSYKKLKEYSGKPYKSKSFLKDKNVISQISQVSAYIHEQIISKDNIDSWKIKINSGTLTFQNEKDKNRVITNFCDFGNILCKNENFYIHENPICIGFEISNEPAYVRELIRNELSRLFNDNYLDPRKGHNKYYILPQKKHFYDIVVLNEGRCDTDEKLFITYRDKIGKIRDKKYD